MTLNYKSNWDSIFNAPFYDDYALDDERRTTLKTLCEQLISNMKSNLELSEIQDINELSTWSGVHLHKTLDQAESNDWFSERLFRVTASIFMGKKLYFF